MCSIRSYNHHELPMSELTPDAIKTPEQKTGDLKKEIKDYVLARLEQPLSDERKQELNAELLTIADFFQEAGIEFYIAGGSGLDLLDGKWDRDHQDVDAAILGSRRHSFYEAATKAGYIITDPDRKNLTLEEIDSSDRHNAFLFRSDASGVSQFEVMFLNEMTNGDIVLNHQVAAPKSLYDQAPKADISGQEVALQPAEVILFHKLMDGRRKDMNDVVKIWEGITGDQRDRVQDWINRSDQVFILNGERVTDIAHLLYEAPGIASLKETEFFNRGIESLEGEEGRELMKKCEEVFAVRETTSTREAFFEALAEKYQGFMPERRATIDAMSDYLYQDPPPTLEGFQAWAKNHVGMLERVKARAVHEYVSQKIWDIQSTKGLEREPAYRKTFLKVAEDFLTEQATTDELLHLPDTELGGAIQDRFQDNLRKHFETSGLSDKIEALRLAEAIESKEPPLDEKALNLIAQASEGTHGWIDMLPSLRNQFEDAGLNCTMGSAMLHLALEKLGYDGVHTVLRKGHHVVIRELPDGSLKLYDPTSLSTKDDQLVGYQRTFLPDQIKNRREVSEDDGRTGFAFTLALAEQDKVGGFYEQEPEGSYVQRFYAYDPSIKMDIAIGLGNLSEIKDDAGKAEAGDEQPTFHLEAYREALVDFISANNQIELGDEDVIAIARENKQTIEELLQAAEAAFKENRPAPNPYDFLQSDQLMPKDQLGELPNPRKFVGSSERYEQAKHLCERYPDLKQLNFNEVKTKFHLFDAHDYLS